MQIILLERVEKLGQMGDVVTVKPGYARNFLLPKNKAARATKQNIENFEIKRKELEAVNLKRKEEAENIATRLAGMSVTVIRQAGESGALYGSVSAKDVAEAMTADGVKADRQQVSIPAPIKMLGVHPIRIILHPEVSTNILVNVALTDEEGKAQLSAWKNGEADQKKESAEKASA